MKEEVKMVKRGLGTEKREHKMDARGMKKQRKGESGDNGRRKVDGRVKRKGGENAPVGGIECAD